MILIAVSIFDRAAQAYMRPFFVPTTGLAVRSFKDEVNRAAADNQMYAHPEDFELYQIGTFDEADGQLETWADGPHLLSRAQDLKE
ncbi:MAG: nonstructural protein [Microvirus sp.]|nr:MAG: nonstructural protein [Microvirus sp.]